MRSSARFSFAIVGVSFSICWSPSHSLPDRVPIAAYFWTAISMATRFWSASTSSGSSLSFS